MIVQVAGLVHGDDVVVKGHKEGLPIHPFHLHSSIVDDLHLIGLEGVGRIDVDLQGEVGAVVVEGLANSRDRLCVLRGVNDVGLGIDPVGTRLVKLVMVLAGVEEYRVVRRGRVVVIERRADRRYGVEGR